MVPRVLIIEDNPTNMELLVYLLSAYGYDLVTAVEGIDGLAKARAGKFDLIICDLEMPKLNGYQVAEQLKASPDTSGIPLLAVTAYAMMGDRSKVLQAGFDGYFSKPIDPAKFVKQVESFLAPLKRLERKPLRQEKKDVEVEDPQKSRRGNILVVDDSPVNLSLIQSTLEPSGYRLCLVETVQRAMKELRRGSFDLILSDLHMPIDSGIEFLRQAKADPQLRAIPFVLFTGSTDESGNPSREYALHLGAAKYLTRPIEPRALLSLVETLLERKQVSSHG
jgi:two-component system, cell cycle response regulator